MNIFPIINGPEEAINYWKNIHTILIIVFTANNYQLKSNTLTNLNSLHIDFVSYCFSSLSFSGAITGLKLDIVVNNLLRIDIYTT